MIDFESALKICFDYKYKKFDNVTITKTPNMMFLLDQVVENEFSKPYVLHLEVTSECNLRCKHCLFAYNKENYSAGQDLSTDEILNFLKYMIREQEIVFVNIIGKEPFMNKDIIKIVKFIKDNNLYLKLQTNGTLIDDSIISTLSQLLDKNNDVLHISIDGATEKIHDEIRGKGNFTKTKNVIKKIRDAELNVLLAFTINAINISTIADLYDLCKEINVKNVLLGLYVDFKAPIDELIPNNEEIVIKCAELIKKIDVTYNVSFDMQFFNPKFLLNFDYGEKLLDEYMIGKEKASTLRCHKCERITVMANGDTYLCPRCITDDKKFSLGSIKTQDFEEIWNNRLNNLFYQKRVYKKSLCKNCKYLSICNGGCLAGSFLTYGTTDAPSPNCEYYKKMESYHEQKCNS